MGKSSFDYKMLLVIRTDLNMSTGKMIAQACHAAVSANEQAKKIYSKKWRNWRDEGAKKVAVKVYSLDELQELAKKAEELDVINIIIEDAGHTEVMPGTITVLGLGPDISHKIDKITGHLPLLK
jgi:PTH2 family peptidyl-tRNA hydrolase